MKIGAAMDSPLPLGRGRGKNSHPAHPSRKEGPVVTPQALSRKKRGGRPSTTAPRLLRNSCKALRLTACRNASV